MVRKVQQFILSGVFLGSLSMPSGARCCCFCFCFCRPVQPPSPATHRPSVSAVYFFVVQLREKKERDQEPGTKQAGVP